MELWILGVNPFVNDILRKNPNFYIAKDQKQANNTHTSSLRILKILAQGPNHFALAEYFQNKLEIYPKEQLGHYLWLKSFIFGENLNFFGKDILKKLCLYED